MGGSPWSDQEIRHGNGEYRSNSNNSISSCLGNLNVLTLNVGGLKSKVYRPEFVDFCTKFEIIGFQETKTDSLDEIILPNFILHFKHRKEVSRTKSGGIGLAFKKQYEQFIHVKETESKLVL